MQFNLDNDKTVNETYKLMAQTILPRIGKRYAFLGEEIDAPSIP